ncbi:MAG: hypothetical protein IJE89_05270 [Bacilli bacterium]|nr:hypothetical protein [Bacilli bacterium]
MIINNKELSLNDAINFSNQEELLLKRRDNNLLLSDYQISVLSKNNIDYKKFSNVRELVFEIENSLDDYYDPELDLVSSQLAEYIYYNETKK